MGAVMVPVLKNVMEPVMKDVSAAISSSSVEEGMTWGDGTSVTSGDGTNLDWSAP